MFLFLLGCCPEYVSFYHSFVNYMPWCQAKKNVNCFIVGFDIDTKSHQCYRDNFQPVVVVPILPILPLYMLNQSRFFRISFVPLLERCMLIWYVSETKKKDSTRISVCFSLCVIKVLCWFHSSAYWCWSMAVALSETKGNWIFFLIN